MQFGTEIEAAAAGATYGRAVTERLLAGADLSTADRAEAMRQTAVNDFAAKAEEHARAGIAPSLVEAWLNSASGEFMGTFKTQRRLAAAAS